ncbi:Ldh family oxidoreductase [Actinophytocola gossypii]|uniref:Ldh family oxidoreductase n=1 Tax=Actinophytocola gossypii TaxID=2812003 RepID=A0ABT2J256_9PSEU|nr:Ldh family oxidoreductase [Actinophytocola gossypii]MCT2581851.1 Ldh family oxidoreductase [Actinophytocola gossypii]
MSADPTSVRLPAPDLVAYAVAILRAAGLAERAARLVAENLVDADRHGVASHGLIRLPIYVRRVREGMVDPLADPVVRTEGARATVDGRNAMGAYVATAGMDAACALADEYGIGSATAHHSNHCGTMAFYARRAARDGYLAVAMSNAPVTMTYHGGRTRAVGTNPVAIAVPRPGGEPVVLDIASSAVARGKIILADSRNEPIPLGWGVDTEGRPTTVAAEALDGAVLPFAGPKGSGLALVIDLLCGVLAGGASGPDIGDMYLHWDRPQNVGHAFFASRFTDRIDRHGQALEQFLGWVGELPTAEGFDAVSLPGQPEERAARLADRHGVPISTSTWSSLAALAADLGVATPAP